DFAVIDVSFISLEKVLLPVREQLRSSARILCLVKPQFEVGPERLGGSGVVRDETLRRFAVEKIERFGRAHGLTPSAPFRSPLPGRDGNREYFLLFENA
ncbi:MAG: TlyA family RNA methyltransferase, partial [Clostridiales bacterium]|nr:TlyA family RNA methyltransferase [Clostridiales bacterium]